MHAMPYLLELIHSQDMQRIEFARGQLSVEQVKELAEHYPTLPDWASKVALVDLVQDYKVPELRPVMLDVLRAPSDARSDNAEWAKAAAVCYLDGDYEQFHRLFTEPEYLLQRVNQFIGSAGLDASAE